MSLLSNIEKVKPFTEPEAWFLFKAAALAEAIGWTLLIIGIGINHYHLIGQKIAVPIAGRIHGTFFLLYFAVLFITYTSLNWSRKKFIVAILAGVPPYGTLIFEQAAAFYRTETRAREFYLSICYWKLIKK